MLEYNICCLPITSLVISFDSNAKSNPHSENCEGPKGWCHWHIAVGDAVWQPSNQSQALETITKIQTSEGIIGNVSGMSGYEINIKKDKVKTIFLITLEK